MTEQHQSDFLFALKTTIPVFMGYIPLGVVYGFLFVQAGADWWIPTLCSTIVYGGAVQYMAIPMFAAGIPVTAIAFATFVVNLRHIFYGLSIVSKVPKTGWIKWLVAGLLTDETYSILSSLPKGTPVNRLIWISVLDYSYWVAGSFLGGVLGTQLQVTFAGFDFVLTSLFAILLCEQWRARVSSWPVWIAIVSYVAARFISLEHVLALSISFCCAGAYLLSLRNRRKAPAVMGD